MAESPREEVFADPSALIVGDWKLIGANPINASDAAGKGTNVSFACWMGPRYPNGTADPKCHRAEPCIAQGGCLFNVRDDVSEHVDLAASRPSKLREMQVRLTALQPSVFMPDCGHDSGLADKYARDVHGGYWGPFVF